MAGRYGCRRPNARDLDGCALSTDMTNFKSNHGAVVSSEDISPRATENPEYWTNGKTGPSVTETFSEGGGDGDGHGRLLRQIIGATTVEAIPYPAAQSTALVFTLTPFLAGPDRHQRHAINFEGLEA